MNKKAIIKLLSSLSLAGAVCPLVSAAQEIPGIENKNEPLTLVENPFTELKQGYSLKDIESYWRTLNVIHNEHQKKWTDLRDLIEKLSSDRKQFKNFCDEILKDKSGDYSKYFETWNSWVSDETKKLADYDKKLNDAIDFGKKLLLFLESFKCCLKHSPGDRGRVYIGKLVNATDRLVGCMIHDLNMFLANKHYCNTWLKYAKEHSDLSNYDKDTINTISNYPKYDDSVNQTKGEIDSWYKGLFTNKQ